CLPGGARRRVVRIPHLVRGLAGDVDLRAGAELVLLALDPQLEPALEHLEVLLLIRVVVRGRRLAPFAPVPLDLEQGTAALSDRDRLAPREPEHLGVQLLHADIVSPSESWP